MLKRSSVGVTDRPMMSIRGITHTHLRGLLPNGGQMDGGKVATLPAFGDTLLPSKAGGVLELDELGSFVEKT